MGPARTIALLLIAGSGAGVGCSFDKAGVASADAFTDPGDDGGGVPYVWRDDTYDDFSIGTNTEGAIIEPWGAIGPAAYLTGGLRARASDTALFADPGSASWVTLEQAIPAGVGFSELLPTSYLADRPRGLGLTSSDSFTVWYDGEIWLDAGENAIAITVDDLGFVDVAAPGSAEFTRVVSAGANVTQEGSYTAAASGWHPVRIAFVEGSIDARLDILLQPPGSNTTALIPRDRLRFRADGVTGLHWLGFDDSLLNAPRVGPFLFAGDAFDYNPTAGDVTSLGLKSGDAFAMRWAGQVRIDVAGAYTFRLETEDGQRIWIDGNLLLDAWNDSPQDQITPTVELDVGWHDLIVDLNNEAGGQRVRLQGVTGPDLVGARLPAARLRPVASRRERTWSALGATTAILDEAIAEVDLRMAAPTNATATAIEVSYTINHSAWEDLEIKVVSPDGAEYILVADKSSALTGTHTLRHTVATPGATVGGLWTLVVTDTEPADVGSIQQCGLTTRYRGGEPPIAILAAYQSPIEELGSVVGFDSVTWAGRLPTGSSVAVRVRTCDTIGGCAVEPWSEPVTTSGDRPAVLARRFAQYRVELTSDGDVAPWLDWIEIGYRGAL